jgi:hypothetical protein
LIGTHILSINSAGDCLDRRERQCVDRHRFGDVERVRRCRAERALPRIRASAPTRVDARFAPPAGGRRTLGINGKHALATWAGCTRRPPGVGARVLSARALVSRSASVRPSRLSRSPNSERDGDCE